MLNRRWIKVTVVAGLRETWLDADRIVGVVDRGEVCWCGSSASRCVCDRPTREEVDTRVLLDGGETKFLHLMEMIEGEAEMPGTVS